jgi:hypothetical protein
VAAHALVASFLGGTTLRDHGLSALGWVALVTLVLGLVAAAILLAPWRLRFAVDARKLYDTEYHFRITATNAAGTAKGEYLTFRTS